MPTSCLRRFYNFSVVHLKQWRQLDTAKNESAESLKTFFKEQKKINEYLCSWSTLFYPFFRFFWSKKSRRKNFLIPLSLVPTNLLLMAPSISTDNRCTKNQLEVWVNNSCQGFEKETNPSKLRLIECHSTNDSLSYLGRMINYVQIDQEPFLFTSKYSFVRLVRFM